MNRMTKVIGKPRYCRKCYQMIYPHNNCKCKKSPTHAPSVKKCPKCGRKTPSQYDKSKCAKCGTLFEDGGATLNRGD